MGLRRGRGWVGVLVVAVSSLAVVASAYPRTPARSGPTSKVPCAKLRRQHRKLPARCRKKPTPAPSPYPTIPPPPTGIVTKVMQAPPAVPLPAGTATLTLNTGSWQPDITNLALTPDAV